MLRRADTWNAVRTTVGRLSELKGEWAGIPLPIGDEHPLIVEKSYRFAPAFTRPPEETALENGDKLKRSFRSTKWRCLIYIIERPDGKVYHLKAPHVHGLGYALGTMMASVAWGIEQEHNALNLLGTLIKHHAFKSYLLTGAFLETSKRSGLTYMFRKLRPTVVIDSRGGGDSEARCLVCLCQHPVGYYQGTWAGALCPTDDVIAHLMLMRGDEVMFWRRSNQHHPSMPEAGL